MANIEIEVNGKTIVAEAGQMLIQVTDAAGIYIPRFCYHPALSIAANCRMCLVEVEKSPKPLPACATPVMPGMKVFTQSAKTIAAQRAVMQFLLINHPLDCPVCDQGGECELQDLAMGYGSSHSHYDECKRAMPELDLGPLIATEMTRCIYCTRCVRFGDEIAGLRELGGTFRGEETEISTYIQHAMQSEVSGNIIDLCPVGALTSKPFRFKARAWELKQMQSIAPHDGMGAHLHVHTHKGQVMRVVARENAELNQTWLADRDRFSYTGLYHDDRLRQPLVRINNQWQAADWKTAFEKAAAGLTAVLTEQGADQLGALASPNATLEEFYLLQKLVRSLGSPHLDHRLREKDTQDEADFPLFPGLVVPYAEWETCDTVLLIGCHSMREQPLAAVRLRQASLRGTCIIAINPADYVCHFNVSAKKIISPAAMPSTLAALAQVLSQEEMKSVEVDVEMQAIATYLKSGKKVLILMGALSMQHPHASQIRYWAEKIAQACNTTCSYLTTGANSAGAWLSGVVPHRLPGGEVAPQKGLSAYEMLKQARAAYILLNVEPDLDCAHARLAATAMKQAKFIVSLSSFAHPLLKETADVILPITPFTETSGTFVNAQGDWQSFTGVAKPYHAARPAWKVLRVLGNFMQVPGFEYESSEAVREEVKGLVQQNTPHPHLPPQGGKVPAKPHSNQSLQGEEGILIRVGEVPLYAVDSLVRRAMPLQQAQQIMDGKVSISLHPETAKEYGVQAGDQVEIEQEGGKTCLPVRIDQRVVPDTAWIPAGVKETAELGDVFGEVTIRKVVSSFVGES